MSNSSRMSNCKSWYSSWGILWNSFIADISDISIDIISGVAHSLGPSIRESHLVGARLHSKTI